MDGRDEREEEKGLDHYLIRRGPNRATGLSLTSQDELRLKAVNVAVKGVSKGQVRGEG
jgi:hypothetical protein